MKLEFFPTPEDMIEASTAREPNRLPKHREIWESVLGRKRGVTPGAVIRVRGTMLILLSLLLAIPSSGLLMIRASGVFGIPFFVAIFILTAALLRLSRRGAEKRIRLEFADDPYQSDAMTVDIDDQGFTITSARRRSSVTWPTVRRFWEMPTVLLIVDDDPKFFMIPKRAFESGDQRQQFDRLLLDRAGLDEPFKPFTPVRANP